MNNNKIFIEELSEVGWVDTLIVSVPLLIEEAGVTSFFWGLVVVFLVIVIVVGVVTVLVIGVVTVLDVGTVTDVIGVVVVFTGI